MDTSITEKKKIIFVISPRTHFLDLAGPDQVFFEAIYFKAPLELEYCSYKEQTNTSSGIPFGSLKKYTDTNCRPGDYIVVPGIDIDMINDDFMRENGDFLDWLKKAQKTGVNICSICTGAFILGAAGILDGKNATTHWKYTNRLQRKHPETLVKENVLFTDDNGVFTSAGIVSGIDLALYIVEKMMGEYFAWKVARELVVYTRRDGNEEQQSIFLRFRNHIHAGIHKVQDWIQENIHQKTSLPELAEMANMSDRNFTRIFKKETGLTVNEFITLVRKERVRELAKNPDLSRHQIARQIGLKSERQLSRIMHQN
jgi:transcriptional regulator GlxA family with amidase domain